MEIETKRLVKLKIQNRFVKLVVAVFSIVFAFAIVSGSVGIGTVTAQQIESINASLVVPAPVDKVWGIVSDVDKDPEYWSVYKEIKNLNKTSNTVERDATLNV